MLLRVEELWHAETCINSCYVLPLLYILLIPVLFRHYSLILLTWSHNTIASRTLHRLVFERYAEQRWRPCTWLLSRWPNTSGFDAVYAGWL